MLVGLVGPARSGKDEVAKILVNHLRYERLAFADAIRGVAEDLNPFIEDTGMVLRDILGNETWEEAKNRYPDVRAFLQRLGVAIRVYDPEFWVRVVTEQVYPGNNYVVTDVRFPNEIKAIENEGGFVYRVNRDGAGLEGANGMHSTELALANFLLPAIDNNGTLDDLEHEVLTRFKPMEPPC